TPSTSMATILICLHFRSSLGAGTFLDRKLLLDNPVERHDLAEQLLEPVQFQLARGVAESTRRVGMRFDEEPVDAHSSASPGEGEDKLRLAAGSCAVRGELDRMCRIQYHRISGLPHDAE